MVDANNDCARKSLDEVGLITFMLMMIIVLSIALVSTVYYVFRTEIKTKAAGKEILEVADEVEIYATHKSVTEPNVTNVSQ